MDVLYEIFVGPFAEMIGRPALFIQTLWEGFASGIMYSLIALGFVLIFKASGVFNFAQGIMVVFAALALVGLNELGVPAWLSVILTLGIMYALAFGVERLVLRPLVGQEDIILFMSTIGLTFMLIGGGQWIFGGETKTMITEELGLAESYEGWELLTLKDEAVFIGQLDLTAAIIATLLIIGLAIFFSKTRIGRALRAVADDHQASLSVGIGLNQIWVVVWFAAGIVALVAGIMWGAKSDVSFGLQVIALKALPVLVLGGFTSIPGAIVGGLIIGVGEKVFEGYWGELLGRGTEAWFAYIIALIFLLFRPQGLFGEKIIERV